MDGTIPSQLELPVVAWRDLRLHVRVHRIVRDGDDSSAGLDVSECVTVAAIDDGRPIPRFSVSLKVPTR